MILFNNYYMFIKNLFKSEPLRFTLKTQQLISNGICPLCGQHEVSEARIKIGYEPEYYTFPNHLFKLIIKRFYKEVVGTVQICKDCKDEFLAYRIMDPSKTVLSHRLGFHRGLINPYSKENIIDPGPMLH